MVRVALLLRPLEYMRRLDRQLRDLLDLGRRACPLAVRNADESRPARGPALPLSMVEEVRGHRLVVHVVVDCADVDPLMVLVAAVAPAPLAVVDGADCPSPYLHHRVDRDERLVDTLAGDGLVAPEGSLLPGGHRPSLVEVSGYR